MLRRTFIVTLLLAFGCSSPLAQQSQRGKGKGPKPPPEPVEMGILFFDGAERRTTTTAASAHPFAAAVLASTSYNRTGTYGWGLTQSTELKIRNYNFDHAGGDNYFNEPSVYLSFYLRRGETTAPQGADIVNIHHTDDLLSNAKLRVEWHSANALRVVTGTGTTNGTTALPLNEWVRIDLQCNTGTSAFWELKINGTTEISGTEDLNANNVSSVVFNGTVSNDDLALDDIVLRDDQYHAGDDFRVETIFPDGNGNYTSWTGAYTDVDETASDGLESTTSTQANRETYTLESIPALSGDDTVDAVMVVATVRKTSNAAVNCQIIERESSTDRDTADFLVLKNDTLQNTYRWLIQDTKPSGGAWTESAVNGYEVGLEHNQSQARDIFLDNINVNVLISTTASGGGSEGAALHQHLINLGAR